MTDDIDFSQYKIIIVDSDNFFCQQLQATLLDADFQVEYERNATAGLKKIKSWKPHIVVSDYVLHGMDYFEFATQVEKLAPQACMIVVSSHHLDIPLIVQLTNLSRVSLTVQKPIKPDALLSRIIEVLPKIDIRQESETIDDDSEDPANVNDFALQREVSRLQFEGKDLPRFVNSLKALTKEAREQPHKSKYLREAVEQCKRITEEVRGQNLPHFEAPFERITNWLNDIIKEGSLPSLDLWDYVQQELESLGEPRKKIGTATLSEGAAALSEPVGEELSGVIEAAPEGLPRAPQWPHTSQKAPGVAPPKRPAFQQPAGGIQKFLIVGNDPNELLLNLGSRYGVSITMSESLESAQAECLAERFDLILLLVPTTWSGERAREAVVTTHEMLRGIEKHEHTPLVVLSATDSLHTRIVTAHLSNSHWISWSAIRKSDAEFLTLKALAAQPITRPDVLIIDSDISDSEDLLRELSRRCSKVDALRDPNAAIKEIEENRPDIILISERTGDLSGFDLCRAIRSSLSFKSITLILEVATISDSSLKGAFRAGVDGVICKTESIESRAEIMLAIYHRTLMSRAFSQETGEKSLEVTTEIREALEKSLKKAIEEQLPLSVCLIDLGEEGLPIDYFAHLWNSKQKQMPPTIASTIHFLSSTQVLLSLVGLRKSTVEKALDEMIQADQMDEAYALNSWWFRCRCYPDDALSLPDLLKLI